MKNEEFNTNEIQNSDGISEKNFEEKQFTNSGRYVEERPLANQEELYRPPEGFDAYRGSSSGGDEGATSDFSASSTASSASILSSMSGIGSIVGAVATAVVSVVIVVAAFISTLSINLSLLIATENSLTFEVQMQGAQEEDFETPIFAILTNAEGEELDSRELWPESMMLEFYNLEPGKEYFVRVQNEEKRFFEKSYVTQTEAREQDFYALEAWSEGHEVFVYVWYEGRGEGGFYTVTAKDQRGKVVFAADGTASFGQDQEEDRSHHFEIPEGTKGLLITLSVGGKVRAAQQIEVWYEPDHPDRPDDPNQHYYEWVQGREPACEDDGVSAHYYCTHCGGYFDASLNPVSENSLVIPALGHAYEWVEEVQVPDEYIFMGHYYCNRCGGLFDENYQAVTKEDLIVYPQSGEHSFEWVEELAPTCEEVGLLAHYYCPDCKGYFDENLLEISVEELEIPAVGHDWDYDEPTVEAWQADGELYAAYIFHCRNNTEHSLPVSATVEIAPDGYYASLAYNGRTYWERVEIESEESELGFLSLENGEIEIRPGDYIQSSDKSYTSFVSSATTPIVISGESTGEVTPICIYNFTGTYEGIEGRGNGQAEDIF